MQNFEIRDFIFQPFLNKATAPRPASAKSAPNPGELRVGSGLESGIAGFVSPSTPDTDACVTALVGATTLPSNVGVTQFSQKKNYSAYFGS